MEQDGAPLSPLPLALAKAFAARAHAPLSPSCGPVSARAYVFLPAAALSRPPSTLFPPDPQLTHATCALSTLQERSVPPALQQFSNASANLSSPPQVRLLDAL